MLLVIAADRQGVSFYGDKRTRAVLGLSQSELGLARKELINLDLLAYDGRIHQLLSLPPTASAQSPPQKTHQSAPKPTKRHGNSDICTESHPQMRESRGDFEPIPDDVRKIFRRILGGNPF